MAGGDVIRDLAEWLIIAFVVLALILEVVLHKLEHWIMNKHPHVQMILRNLQRELMILGIVSFGFIMYLFANSPSKDLKMTFEVAHVFVFLFAVFHVFVVALAVFISLRLSKRWTSFERMHLSKYLKLKEKYRKLTEKRIAMKNPIWRYCTWWMPNPNRLLQYNYLHEVMAFQDLRFQFIYYRNLKPDFRFSKFLRKIKMGTFIKLVEINPVNWCLLVIIILLDLIRHDIGSHKDFEAKFFIAHSVFNILSVTLLRVKIQRVYWSLTKNPETYYDAASPNAFQQQLSLAEKEVNIQGAAADNRLDFGFGVAANHSNLSSDIIPDPGSFRRLQDRTERNGKRMTSDLPLRKSLDPPRPKRPIPSTAPPRSPANRSPSSSFDKTCASLHSRPSPSSSFDFSMAHSLDVSTRLSMDELASIESYWHTTKDRVSNMLEERRKQRMEALKRLRERRRRNNALVESAAEAEMGQNAKSARTYPKWLVKLFPYFGRVPSEAEKLFWFSSHRFYLFSMENILFFMNINLAASIARLIFWLKEMSEYQKQKKTASSITKVSRMVIDEVVRGVVKAKKKQEPPSESLVLVIIALVVACIASLYVLLQVAGIMRKYIFVLNNANLLPEDITMTTIQTVNFKDIIHAETLHNGSEDSSPLVYDSEAEHEGDEAAELREARENMSFFFEVEQGKHGSASDNSVAPFYDPFV